MKKRKGLSLLLSLCLLLLALPVPARAQEEDLSFVRVKLSTESVSSLTVTVKGTYILSEANRSFSDGRLTLKANGNQVSVSHSAEGALYSGTQVTLERLSLDRNAGYLRFTGKYGTRNYLGNFTVTAPNGFLQLVNRVPMAHYLYGVVGHEMSNTFPVEALKAQAITAKCYALLSLSPSRDYDIGDTSSDQVYRGYTESNTNVIAACDAVANEALYLNDQVITCYYAASNGGYRLKPSSVWSGPSPYDSAYSEGEDPYDMKNPFSPRELIPLPTNFFENTTNPVFYNFILERVQKALKEQDLIPRGYEFQSIYSLDNALSYNSQGTTDGVDHVGAVVELTVSAILKKLPEVSPVAELSTLSTTPSVENPATTEKTPENPPTDGQNPGESLPEDPEITPDAGEPLPATVDNPVDNSPTPLAEEGAEETPGPEPTLTPSPTPALAEETPIPVNLFIPLAVNFTFEELDQLNFYENSSLRIMYMVKTEDGFALQRCRYGHGVGMSQRGAQQMALEGMTYDQILSFYYSGARLDSHRIASPEQDVTPSPTPAIVTTAATALVTGSPVNLRTAASTESDSQGRLEVGTGLVLTGLFGDWYQVRVPETGKTGYCYKDYIAPQWDGLIARGYVNASAVNFRSGPGTDYDPNGKLSKNTPLGLYGISGDWYRIQVLATGKTGWILKKYVTVTDKAIGEGGANSTITLTPSPTPAGMTPIPAVTPAPLPTATPTPIPTPAGPYALTGTINASRVNIRTGASTSTKSLGKLNKGTALGVLEKIGSWYSVTVLNTGVRGYVYGKYVTVAESEATSGQTAAAGQINASRVNLRRGPSTSYNSLGRLNKGTKLSVLSSSGSWYQVEVTGTGERGYVFAKYVTLSSAAGSQNKGIVTALVNLRSLPSVERDSKVMTTMKKGDIVTVLSRANGWCYVRYGDLTGYCIASVISG